MSFGEFTMYKISNKSIAAFAVFAMLVAGFGAFMTVGDNDATETPAVTYSYVNGEDGELYADLAFDLKKFAGADFPTTVDGQQAAVIGFVDDVFDKYSEDAKVIITYGFVLTGTTVDKMFPAYLLDYIDADAKEITITATSKADTALITTIASTTVPAGATFELKYDVTVIDVIVDLGTAVALTPEEQAAIEASIALLTEQVAELQADVAAKEAKIAELQEYIEELEEGAGELIAELKAQVADLEAQVAEDKKVIDEKNSQIALDLEEIALKNAKIADLEKQLAEKKGGDATLAWCVAAIGIIAAVVLAGFILIVFNKANKEGRRLL